MSLFCPECQSSYADESMRVCPADGTRLYQVDSGDPLIGGVIDGRFRVDYTLGIGGMGTVYGGVQLSVNRAVAIKVLRTELSTREVALERFFREAKTISNLTHPNIVKLVDFGQDRDRGLLYLVMELVKGENLSELIGKGRLRASMALEIVYQVCGALTEPHAEGVIHRDLKPDNLLMVPVSDGTAQVKVLDFGIARFMESNTQLTGTGMICGTPAYMAPEQAQNETLDARTDLYALGVILYELLSGWPPFSGTSSLQIMLKHIQENPPRLRELLPPATLPEAIEQLTYELMSKERTGRPMSARDVRDRIDDIRRDLGLERVRLDGEQPLEKQFDEFILPKLPRPDHDKSGPTQVLRRETGLEKAVLTSAESGEVPTNVWGNAATQADAALGVTGPLTPNGKAEVMGDAQRLKIETRGGGQQAWTPGDQNAVRSIKDTKEGVDAMGATVDAASIEGAPTPDAPPRKTLVESDDSKPLLKVSPSTGDAIPAMTAVEARRDPDATATGERREVKTSSSNVPLVVIAVLAAVGTIGAAFYVVKKIEDVTSKQTVAEKTIRPAPEPKPEPAAADPAAIADFVSARVIAQTRVHAGFDDAVTEAEESKSVKPEKSPPKKTASKKKPDGKKPAATAKKPDEKTPNKTDDTDVSKDPDETVEKLNLRAIGE